MSINVRLVTGSLMGRPMSYPEVRVGRCRRGKHGGAHLFWWMHDPRVSVKKANGKPAPPCPYCNAELQATTHAAQGAWQQISFPR